MDMWDAVTWENLEGKVGAKAGYVDGRVSMWPPEAWQAFQHDPLLHITVLADQVHECFDVEAGNATADQVAAAIANRLASRQWSVVYCNQSTVPNVQASLKGKGLVLAEAEFWPAPGVYLWVSDPSGNIPAGRYRPPVTPVAVQDQWTPGWDHSTTHGTFPAVAGPVPVPQPPPQPPPPALSEVTVIVPQLEQGVQGPSVTALQRLLTDVAVDGIFGPVTHAAVVQFQGAHGLAQDGIVGVHTWGSLCGRPQ